MKYTVLKKLLFPLIFTVILSVFVFVYLMNYNRKITEETATELGALYLEEMMIQMQEHFSSIVDVKHKETEHIAKWTENEEGYRETLRIAAESMDFEYLVLYDAEGNSELVLGDLAWFRDTEEYLEQVMSGKTVVTTGYLTKTGEKIIAFGTPATFTMESGANSSVMIAGFSVEKLYEYIKLDKVEPLGSKVNMWIMTTNGAYILKAKPIEEDSLFERLNNWGSFVGIEIEEATSQIEKAMAGGKNFSYMVSIDGMIKHIFGAPAEEPDNWYFMITMPQGISDEVLMEQNSAVANAFAIAGLFILLMICGVFLVYYQISAQQRKELEIAWQDAEDSRNIAESASMAKTFFLSNMSHDIRTPMNAIIGFTNLAMKEKEMGAVHKYLQKISVSSKHLLLLINEILEMSRIESGKIVLDETPCNLLDLLEELHTVLGRKAEEKKMNFRIQGNVQDSYVYGDKRRLQQILINLADNAIKYTPEQGEVSVVLSQVPCDRKGYGNYEVVISDNGIGMSEEFAQRIFEPFERENTSTVSSIEGTGLGLSIVKNFVDMLGGEIEVESKKGQGSVFTVKVGLRLLEEDRLKQMREIHKNRDVVDRYDEETASQFFNGKHVLLVDDNEFNREIAQSILEHVGFIVDTAENGEIAVEKIKEAEPDYYNVILIDVQMPVMNGYEATKAIRGMEGMRSKVRIIAVTANAFESDRKNVLAAGMDNYITKPIDTEMLYRVLKESESR